MNSINVRIQGETDWLSYNIEIDLLTNYISRSISLPKLAFRLGEILDGYLLKPLTFEKKVEVGRLLPQYIANSEIYQMMLQHELKSLQFTSFRLESKLLGYKTRFAGAVRGVYNDVIVTSDKPNGKFKCDPEYLILLKLIGSNPAYYIDKYHPNCLSNEIIRSAKLIKNSIKIFHSNTGMENFLFLPSF